MPNPDRIGERAHLLSPAVDLTTHIQDITAVLEYEDLRDVVLVGHRYGGMVIAGVAEKAAPRVPVPGLPPRFGVTDQDDVGWMEARLGDHPNKTFTDPAQLSVDKKTALRLSFIQCTKAPSFSEAAERAKREGFRFRELFVAGHDAMITQPQALAAMLMDFL